MLLTEIIEFWNWIGEADSDQNQLKFFDSLYTVLRDIHYPLNVNLDSTDPIQFEFQLSRKTNRLSLFLYL